MKGCIAREGGEENNNMPVNGAAANGEAALQDRPPLPESKIPRVGTEAKDGSEKQSSSRRRRGAKHESANNKGEERFFLAAPEGGGGSVPALGRECTSEAEAIIESFRGKLNFYELFEFQTRADIEPSGDPVLRKEVVRSNHIPAS